MLTLLSALTPTCRPLEWRRDPQGVRVGCRGCGEEIAVDPTWVRPDGLVLPSVICRCGFHALCRLHDWKD